MFENPDYDDAIIGITGEGRVVYEFGKMVEHLCIHEGMTENVAIEFIMFNTIGALPNAGELSPVIIYSL